MNSLTIRHQLMMPYPGLHRYWRSISRRIYHLLNTFTTPLILLSWCCIFFICLYIHYFFSCRHRFSMQHQIMLIEFDISYKSSKLWHTWKRCSWLQDFTHNYKLCPKCHECDWLKFHIYDFLFSRYFSGYGIQLWIWFQV